MAAFTQLLWHLLVGTRGGETRTRILVAVHETPGNVNQLSERLELDYKTVQYHVRLLEENTVLTVIKKGKYGATYFPSESLQEHSQDFEKIRNAYGMNLGKQS